jgi:hypothetical protein
MSFTDKLLALSFVKDGRLVLPRNPDKSWSKRDPAALKGLCLHQSLEAHASAHGTAKYDCGPNHISNDGLPGLSYTGFVERDGILWLAWDVEEKTWSQGYKDRPGDENEEFMAICVGGDFSGPGYLGTQEPTPEQMTTVSKLWEACKEIWGWKNNQLYGHYNFGKPACPGYTVTDMIASFNATKDWTDPLYDLDEIDGRQQALKHLGWYKGEIGGPWSLECRMALELFQGSCGLNNDGVWGPKTNAMVTKWLLVNNNVQKT